MTTQAVQEWMTLGEAADYLGISVTTLRRRVKAGDFLTRKIPHSGGYRYELKIINDQPGSKPIDHPIRHDPDQQTAQNGHQTSLDLSAALQLLASQQAEVSRLNDELVRVNNERAELYGRLGFLQGEKHHLLGQLQHAQETIKLLEAPAPPEPEPVKPKPWWRIW